MLPQTPDPADSGHGLEQGWELSLQWPAGDPPLLPVVVQDRTSLMVLILAWLSPEALDRSLTTGAVTLWSRTRGRLWVKGESSGNRLSLHQVRVNCEQNSLLFLVDPLGQGACHALRADGRPHLTCFYRSLAGSEAGGGPVRRLEQVPGV